MALATADDLHFQPVKGKRGGECTHAASAGSTLRNES